MIAHSLNFGSDLSDAGNHKLVFGILISGLIDKYNHFYVTFQPLPRCIYMQEDTYPGQ
jgi:hypothetical protein